MSRGINVVATEVVDILTKSNLSKKNSFQILDSETKMNGSTVVTIRINPHTAKRIDPHKVGTVFQIKKRTYEVIGVNLNRWKNSVRIKRIPDGRTFICKPQLVVDGFLYVRGE